jgi:SAM-dependent methyltransferase
VPDGIAGHQTTRTKPAQCEPGFVEIHDLNEAAWDRAVDQGENPYTQVVTSEQVSAARGGTWDLYLSELRPVPHEWFPPLPGLRVLCLASGGGQQGPIFAAAGAEVTVLDASAKQLAVDKYAAERDGLGIRTVQGDMADLSAFETGSLDLVFNPPSTLFVPELDPIWRECYRVLTADGLLMTGFMNPDEFVFDPDALDEEGVFVVRYPLPYIEHETLSRDELEQRQRDREMFHFSHSMEAQLGGLLAAGFVITGFYEDRRSEADGNPIRHYLPSNFVVRAHKAWANARQGPD